MFYFIINNLKINHNNIKNIITVAKIYIRLFDARKCFGCPINE